MIKVAIVFFLLGVVQGFILTDWLKDKQTLHLVTSKSKK